MSVFLAVYGRVALCPPVSADDQKLTSRIAFAPPTQIRHLVQSKLALVSADRTAQEQELSLYGTLKMILAEQVDFIAKFLFPTLFFNSANPPSESVT
jgi:hypothetical protein